MSFARIFSIPGSVARRRACAIALALLLASCDEVRSSYATVEDARERNVFDKGWLPDVLPASATDIAITANLDTSTCHGRFRLPAHDVEALVSRLTPGLPDFRRDVWKDELDGLRTDGHAVMSYASDRVGFAFVCDREEGTCRFWCG